MSSFVRSRCAVLEDARATVPACVPFEQDVEGAADQQEYDADDSECRPCPLLVKYVEAGWLGKKTKRGFYDYSTEIPTPTR